MANHLIQGVRLSLFYFWMLFLSGRMGLFLHEFAGHALSCRLMGGQLGGFSLFLFGGGRVHCSYAADAAQLSVFSMLAFDLSGIAVELATGVLLAILSITLNMSRPLRTLLASTASVLIVHSLFYLTISTYYGSGDGTHLFTILHQPIRQLILPFVFALTVAGAFLAAYLFSPIARSWVMDYPSKRRLLICLVCIFAAVMLHAALTVGERVMTQDKVYDDIKTSESVRSKKKELSEYISDYKQAQGRAPDQDRITIVEKELEDKYGQFPLEIPLGLAIVVAFVAGFIFSKHRDDDEPNPVTWRIVVLLGGCSTGVAILILIANRI